MFIDPELMEKALAAIGGNKNVLINMVSHRVKQLERGADPQVHSLKKLTLEDIALLEIIEHKIQSDY